MYFLSHDLGCSFVAIDPILPDEMISQHCVLECVTQLLPQFLCSPREITVLPTDRVPVIMKSVNICKAHRVACDLQVKLPKCLVVF